LLNKTHQELAQILYEWESNLILELESQNKKIYMSLQKLYTHTIQNTFSGKQLKFPESKKIQMNK